MSDSVIKHKELLDRLELFNDSDEIARALWSLEPPKRDGAGYWTREAADHIDGLYELAKMLAKMLKTEGSKMDKKINYWSVKQLAARYGVHYTTVWRWLEKNGDFPKPIRFSGNCTRWKSTDIEAWEKSHG